jgi:hypothetical protein
MRVWVTALAATVLMLGMTGCQRAAVPAAAPQTVSRPPAPAPVTPAADPDQASFKGMELYSVKATDGRWHFYVLGGTNRQKRLSEVTASSPVVGTDAVKLYLRSLPPGSSIAWQMQVIDDRPATGRLGWPDSETVKVIRDVCRLAGIDLKLPPATGVAAAAARYR